MKYPILAILVMIMTNTAHADLYSRFKNPPREYSPVPFWFLNGKLDRNELRRQVKQMTEQHVYGAFMHARTGLETPYLSDKWWNAISAIVDAGKANGFKPWIYDEYNWPSGQANGKVTADHPEFLPRSIVVDNTEVVGPSRYEADIDTKGLVGVSAARVGEDGLDPDTVQDITGFLDNARLSWDMPKGKWVVMVARKAVQGRYVDVLNRGAMERFVDLTHEEYAKRFGDKSGSAIPGTFTDEPNIRAYSAAGWTEGFLEHFKKIKGYDFKPYVGVLYHRMGDQTTKLRCDYLDVLTTLYEQNYWKLLADWAGEHEMVSTGHVNREEELVQHMRLSGDAMRCLRWSQIPGVDCVGGPRLLEIETMKLGSSVSHLYGRERTMCETYAGCGHAFTMQEMKWMADWQYAGGINMIVPHGFFYTMAGKRQRNDWPPSMFYQQPYWPHYHLFADYISRLSSALSGGIHVADIAVYYPIKTIWANFNFAWCDDEDCPRLYNDVLHQLFQNRLDFDILDDDSLAGGVVSDGVLHIRDMQFRVIVLPGAQVLPDATAAKLAEFQAQGGHVICVGREPSESSDGVKGNEAVTKVGKDSIPVETAEGAEKLIRKLIKTDVRVAKGQELYYNHIKQGDTHLYFISSQIDQAQEATIEFSATGFPELWDPATGDAYALHCSTGDGYAKIEMHFEPYESHLVVFRPVPSKAPVLPKYEPIKRIELPMAWDFSAEPYHYRGETLPPGYRESKIPSSMPVGDWCEHGLKVFSGTGIYRATFDGLRLRRNQRLMLDLGEARVVASVYVNDKLVGSRAWRPFKFDLTDLVEGGVNDLRVEVANTIGNRITLFDSSNWDRIADDALRSGLLGPVRLEVVERRQ